MNQLHADSSPDMDRLSRQQQYNDSSLEGVAANLKLLLKLIQDHKDACGKEKTDKRRALRVATMLTILDNVRDRIQKSQSFGCKKSEPELRRCSTNVGANRDKNCNNEALVDDEKERLRRELSASMAARKSLQVMCSSLGKEKEIMAAELSKKVHELSEMEELLDDWKTQSEKLLQKVREYASEHKKINGSSNRVLGESQAVAALQERNKALSQQLMRSLDGHCLMKTKLEEAQEENAMMRSDLDEIREKVGRSLVRVRQFKESVSSSDLSDPVEEQIAALEGLFEELQMHIRKHEKTRWNG